MYNHSWIFEVRVHNFSNPNNLSIENINKNFSCCDVQVNEPIAGACSLPCDNYFLFCLQLDTDEPTFDVDDCRFGLVSTPIYSSSSVTFQPPITLTATGIHWKVVSPHTGCLVYTIILIIFIGR